MKCSTRGCKKEAAGRIPVFKGLCDWKIKAYCKECLAVIAKKIAKSRGQ